MATQVLEPKTRSAVATMTAAVVHDFQQPLRVEKVHKPIPGEGQALVRIEASGLCHTDIHAAHGDWPVKPTPPFTPGHEGVGIVTELGPGVTEVAVGDRVAIPWLGYACGMCEHCVGGWETLCLEQKNTGYSIDGGFAEYVAAYARYVVRVPAGIDPLDAAPLTCAGVTTYKAVKVAGTKPSDLVAVFGVGGLGHLAIQYAAVAGGTVVAVDLFDEKLELARELGATHTVNARTVDPVEAIQALGGADQAIALAARLRPSSRRTVASPRRHARLRRAAEGEPHRAADLRDGAERRHHRRLDRRDAERPARGVRASRAGTDAGDPRDSAAGRRERGDRGRRGRPRRGPDRVHAVAVEHTLRTACGRSATA